MTSVQVLESGRIRVNDAVISRKGDGFLGCDRHGGHKLCAHVRDLLREGSDWMILGAPEAELVGMKVPIPLIPKYDIWTWVKFTERIESVMAYKIQLYITKDKGSARTIEETYLGFLHRGEGRLVIRSMIIDWFRGSVEVDRLRCESTSHGFRQEQRWRKDTFGDLGDDAFAQWWSVWQSGFCLDCAGLLNNFDDLVPAGNGSSGVFS